MDWMNPTVSESAKEREVEMSGLVAGFSTQMRKQAANAQEETTPDLEAPNDKRSRPSGLYEKVQVDPTVISMDSSK